MPGDAVPAAGAAALQDLVPVGIGIDQGLERLVEVGDFAGLGARIDAVSRRVIGDGLAVLDLEGRPEAGLHQIGGNSEFLGNDLGAGEGAADLEVKPSNFAFITAITHFARALGAVRAGKPEAAKADIAKLAELRDKLRDAKDAYWAEQIDIQRQVAAAWVLYAQGQYDEALKAMAAAADD